MDRFRIQSNLEEQGGRWYVHSRVYDAETGQKFQRKRSTKIIARQGQKRINKKKAEAIMPDMECKIMEEFREIERQSEPLLSDYVNRWIETKKSALRGNTMEAYRQYADGHILPALGAYRVADISFGLIQDYVTEKGQSLSADSLKKQMSVINGSLDIAVADGIIPINPARVAKFTFPKTQKFKSDSYTDAELSILIQGAKAVGEPMLSVITLAAIYGLRREEILGLRWQDINFQSKELTIQNTVVKGGGSIIEEERTKTKKSHRQITLVEGTIPYLEELKQQHMDNGWKLDKVVRHKNGNDVRPDYITRARKKLMKDCGLRQLRLHDLRRTAASMLATQLSPKQVQDLLGHENISTTMDIYTKLHRKERDETAGAMDSVLKNAGICY